VDVFFNPFFIALTILYLAFFSFSMYFFCWWFNEIFFFKWLNRQRSEEIIGEWRWAPIIEEILLYIRKTYGTWQKPGSNRGLALIEGIL
jgi:hypothetical protein